MGRPINKRYFGPLDGAGLASADGKDQAGNTLTDGNIYSEKKRGWNMPVQAARVPGQSEVTNGGGYPFIINQKGSKKYRVQTSSTTSHVGNCVLVNKTSSLNEGEMTIAGFLSGDSGVGPAVLLAKITKFYAVDFSGNRYKWYIDNDGSSVGNTLILVTATDATIN